MRFCANKCDGTAVVEGPGSDYAVTCYTNKVGSTYCPLSRGDPDTDQATNGDPNPNVGAPDAGKVTKNTYKNTYKNTTKTLLQKHLEKHLQKHLQKSLKKD
jgi:hypothetical protein